MKEFEYLEHTADALFKAYGKTLEQLFENSAKALCGVMYDAGKAKSVGEIEIKEKAETVEELLHKFLDSLLFEAETKKYVFGKFKIKVKELGKGFELEAKCFGEQFNPEKHSLKAEVKAVTWNSFFVKKEGKSWAAQVLVDI